MAGTPKVLLVNLLIVAVSDSLCSAADRVNHRVLRLSRYLQMKRRWFCYWETPVSANPRWDALLGFEPGSDSDKPFKVEPTGKSVTLEVNTYDGTRFGKGEEPALRVVDTPGMHAFVSYA